jgi:hypothetical protein
LIGKEIIEDGLSVGLRLLLEFSLDIGGIAGYLNQNQGVRMEGAKGRHIKRFIVKVQL